MGIDRPHPQAARGFAMTPAIRGRVGALTALCPEAATIAYLAARRASARRNSLQSPNDLPTLAE
jgi:hypothetical protein